jgi:hypothetical protein
MAGKAGDDIKGSDIVKAFVDLVILVALMIGSGFGGYWYGIHERLAPVKNVAPGTPGALPATAVTPAAPGTQAPPTTPAPVTAPATTTTTTTSPPAPATSSGKKEKFWVTSSGTDYIGYNITVSVNGKAVDSFYGPDKMIDITRFVKHGDNTITFDAKNMPTINNHKGQSSAMLTLQLAHGAKITEDVDPKAVILSYTRNAAQTEDDSKDLTFTDGD